VAGECFQPLHLGAANPDGLPDSHDGIVFGPFVEGQPGIQPERMPARSTNFNPGYDPDQPLYIPTPVFEAVKAAYAPDGPLPSQWNHLVQSPPRPQPPEPTITQVVFIGDPEGDLKRALESCGVPADTGVDHSKLLIIDGRTLDGIRLAEARKRMQEIQQSHGTVFIWVAPENLDNVNFLLPARISLLPQKTSALFADRQAPETASIALADLYFGNQADKTILSYGLAGPLVKDSKILMMSMFFSEGWIHDTSENGSPALIVYGNGCRILLTTLMADVRSERRLKLMRSLFSNLGVRLSGPSKAHDTGFDGAGYLNQALLLGSFQGEPYPKILDHDFTGNEARIEPRHGDKVGERQWQFTPACEDGLFDFFRIGIPGTEDSRAHSQGAVLKPEALDANNYLEVIERISGTNPGTNSVVYVSFWIHCPYTVDATKLDLLIRSDDGVKIWVNARQIFEDRRIYGPGITDAKRIPVAFEEGWNHVLAKVGQLDGLWNFSVRFESNEPDLVSRLRAAAEPPQ
jgi:beta-galactosidase